METKSMETKDILLQLRTKAGLSQDELAERMFVTRQAVSRWERGSSPPLRIPHHKPTLTLLPEHQILEVFP